MSIKDYYANCCNELLAATVQQHKESETEYFIPSLAETMDGFSEGVATQILYYFGLVSADLENLSVTGIDFVRRGGQINGSDLSAELIKNACSNCIY